MQNYANNMIKPTILHTNRMVQIEKYHANLSIRPFLATMGQHKNEKALYQP